MEQGNVGVGVGTSNNSSNGSAALHRYVTRRLLDVHTRDLSQHKAPPSHISSSIAQTSDNEPHANNEHRIIPSSSSTALLLSHFYNSQKKKAKQKQQHQQQAASATSAVSSSTSAATVASTSTGSGSALVPPLPLSSLPLSLDHGALTAPSRMINNTTTSTATDSHSLSQSVIPLDISAPGGITRKSVNASRYMEETPAKDNIHAELSSLFHNYDVVWQGDHLSRQYVSHSHPSTKHDTTTSTDILNGDHEGSLLGSLEAAAARSMASYHDLNRSLISPRQPVGPPSPMDARRAGPKGNLTATQHQRLDDERLWLLHLHEGSTTMDEQISERHRQQAIDSVMASFLAKDHTYRRARADAVDGQYVQYDLNLSRVSCATPPPATLDSAFQWLATDDNYDGIINDEGDHHDHEHGTHAATTKGARRRQHNARSHRHVPAVMSSDVHGDAPHTHGYGHGHGTTVSHPIFITEPPVPSSSSSSSSLIAATAAQRHILQSSNSNGSGILMIPRPPGVLPPSPSSSHTDLTRGLAVGHAHPSMDHRDALLELYIEQQHETQRAEEKRDDRQFDRLKQWGLRSHRSHITVDGVGSLRGAGSDRHHDDYSSNDGYGEWSLMGNHGTSAFPEGDSLAARLRRTLPNGIIDTNNRMTKNGINGGDNGRLGFGRSGSAHIHGHSNTNSNSNIGMKRDGNNSHHSSTASFKAMPGIAPRHEADQLSAFINKSGVSVNYKDVLGALVAPSLRTSAQDNYIPPTDRRSLFADIGTRLVYDPLPHIKPPSEPDIILAVAQDEVKKPPTPPPYFAREFEEQEYERLLKYKGPPWMFRPVRRLIGDDKLTMFEQDWKEMMLPDVVTSAAARQEVRAVLWKHYDEIRNIFAFYGSQSGPISMIGHISSLTFIHFCHTCRIPDKSLTVTVIDTIFHRVNVEEEFDMKLVEEAEERQAAIAAAEMRRARRARRRAGYHRLNQGKAGAAGGSSTSSIMSPAQYGKLMSVADDPDNPDNQFTRSEFMEALVRMAAYKYKDRHHDTSADKLERLLLRHVLPRALDRSVTAAPTIRGDILHPDVQTVYRKYVQRLYQMFLAYSSKPGYTTGVVAAFSAKKYELFLKDFGLIGANLSRRAALVAFALARDEHDDQSMLKYPSFLELIARLAATMADTAAAATAANAPGTVPPTLPEALDNFCDMLLASRRPRYDWSSEARDLFRSFEQPSPSPSRASPSRISSLRRRSSVVSNGAANGGNGGNESVTPDHGMTSTPSRVRRASLLRRASIGGGASSSLSQQSDGLTPSHGAHGQHGHHSGRSPMSTLRSLDEEVAVTTDAIRHGRRRRGSITSEPGELAIPAQPTTPTTAIPTATATATNTQQTSHRRYSSMVPSLSLSNVSQSGGRGSGGRRGYASARAAAHARQTSQPPVVMRMPSVVFPPPTNVITSPVTTTRPSIAAAIASATPTVSTSIAMAMVGGHTPLSPTKGPKSFSSLFASPLSPKSPSSSISSSLSSSALPSIASTHGSISVVATNAAVHTVPSPSPSPSPVPLPSPSAIGHASETQTPPQNQPDAPIVPSTNNASSSSTSSSSPSSASMVSSLTSPPSSVRAVSHATIAIPPSSLLPPSLRYRRQPSITNSGSYDDALTPKQRVIGARTAATTASSSLHSPPHAHTHGHGHDRHDDDNGNDIDSPRDVSAVTNTSTSSDYNFGSGDALIANDHPPASNIDGDASHDRDTDDGEDSLLDEHTNASSSPTGESSSTNDDTSITSSSSTVLNQTDTNNAPATSTTVVASPTTALPAGTSANTGGVQRSPSIVNIGSASFGGMTGPKMPTTLEYTPVMTQAAAALPGTPHSAAYRISSRVSTLRPSPQQQQSQSHH